MLTRDTALDFVLAIAEQAVAEYKGGRINWVIDDYVPLDLQNEEKAEFAGILFDKAKDVILGGDNVLP